eukprot:m.261086 g.261086  ORF g.261086 m.261086 type:complete len:99 (-) comp19687_c0_seq4:32-328(-)
MYVLRKKASGCPTHRSSRAWVCPDDSSRDAMGRPRGSRLLDGWWRWHPLSATVCYLVLEPILVDLLQTERHGPTLPTANSAPVHFLDLHHTRARTPKC